MSLDQVDYVVMGQSSWPAPAKTRPGTAAVAGGVLMNVPSITITKGLPLRHQRDRPG